MNKNTFTPHGYYTISNTGGYEVEIHPSGDSARIRYYDGEISDWLEITHQIDPENEDETISIIDEGGLDIPLNQVMKI